MRAVRGISEMVMKPGLVNLDFADLRAILENAGTALVSFGESSSENRAIDAIEEALKMPLLDVDISGGSGALLNIQCGPDLSLDEIRQIVETVSQELDPEAPLIWGAQVDEELRGTVRVLLIVTGVKTPFLTKPVISKPRKEEKPTIKRPIKIVEEPLEDLEIEEL